MERRGETNGRTGASETGRLDILSRLTQQMLKTERTEKIELARSNGLQNLPAEERPPIKNGGPRETPEAEPKDANGTMSKQKAINFSIEDALFMKNPLSALYKKFMFKINAEKKVFVLEFEPVNEKALNISKAKLEVRFSDTVALNIIKESDLFEMELKAIQALTESSKKKNGQWTQTTLGELLQKEELRVLPEVSNLSLKLQKNDFAKIMSQKSKIAEICRLHGLTLRDGPQTRSKPPTNLFPFEEIKDEKIIQDLRTAEQNINNWTHKNRMEGYEKLNLPKFTSGMATKKFCPVYQCFKEFPSVLALKNHIDKEHPVLNEAKIKVEENGQIAYPDEIVAKVFVAAHMFNKFMNDNVIRIGAKRLNELNGLARPQGRSGEANDG